MGFASVSLSSCLEVVPEETREWKPEIAPQATVVNRIGKRYCTPFPLSTAKPVKAGNSSGSMLGWAPTTPINATASIA